MGNVFAGSEIVELGIQIERNGRDFYNILVNQTENQKSKDIFKFLACEEEKHIETFQKILDSVQKHEPPGAFTEEYFAYMKAMASVYVFTEKDKGKTVAKEIQTDTEAVELGMGFEQDSIEFYEGMKKIVPPNDCKLLEELIAQEENHIKKLLDIKESLA